MARREKDGIWVKICAAVFYPITWLGKRVTRGTERIPRRGGAILVFNHVSHLDPVIDAVFVHRNKRVPRFLAKDSLFRIPVAGRIIAGAGTIPVYRGTSNAAESLRDATKALSEGKIVCIYPEGTISKDPEGWPMRSFPGVARLALTSDVPVLPIARWGTNHIYNGYTKKFSPFPRKTITTYVGEPVDLSQYRGEDPPTNTALVRVTELIMNDVKKLLAEIRGEQAPAGYFNPKKKAES
ncbi:lysophospholipid acyltransferase family protein [Kibdelosporangium phytohabitans]|uniref:Acyl-phosphate glycerol 3-phosphate acyltransferase n=1 Tax=Kibdelosporangium phytohabitans TaxID=860235 RepID=A0A0N9IDH7_9PSEU|nr:lysophospholipid acyltransferase family protein [Kibdelosporangium phytohabitans]ALG13113.1 acyl-phosphate glycerol 3-phosphate acyltransferase [Kibdelosporangium phytohabitans]MBE1464854.1 1-acyl-sn-glycerol-3-phosphate acyltransferase [Kibdelosporangium phytohabitans]